MGAPGKSWRKALGLSREAKVMHRIKVWVRRRENLEKKLKGRRNGAGCGEERQRFAFKRLQNILPREN